MTRDHDDLDRHLRRIAQALVDDGSAASHGRSRSSIPAGPPARRRTAAWLGAAAASIAVAGVAALIAFGGHPPSRAPGAAPTTTSIVGPAVVPTTSCPDAVVTTTVPGTILDTGSEVITIDQCVLSAECAPADTGPAPATVMDASTTTTSIVCFPGPAIGADGVVLPTVPPPEASTTIIDQALPESRFSQADSGS